MNSAILRATTVVRATARSIVPPLSVKLRDLHRRWMAETLEWLGPTLARDADFWNGWSAVRYINDQFDRQYRRECGLVAAILPLLQPADAFSLCAATVVLERTRRDLDQLGRRQGMIEAVRAVAGRFLMLLRSWFAEIDRVTEGLTLYDLSPEGRQAIAQLTAAAATWR
jgi:hypothetical protein